MKLFRANKETVFSLGAATRGKVIPMSDVPDEVFAGEILGKGYGIDPHEGIFYAPMSGRVETVAETKHAYTLLSPQGIELLLHIGVDTVSMEGKGFEPQVREGQTVNRGDPLCRADLNAILDRGLSPITSVIVTNTHEIDSIRLREGNVQDISLDVMTFRIHRKSNRKD